MRFASRSRSRRSRRAAVAALGCLLLCAGVAAHTSPPPAREDVRLRSGTLRGPDDSAGLPPRLLAGRHALERGGPAILSFRESLTPAARAALEEAGIRLEASLGARAFVALLPDGGLAEASRIHALAWIAPYHPGLRLAPEVAAIDGSEPRDRVPLTIQLFAGADATSVARRLVELGLPVAGVSPGRVAEGRLSARPGQIVVLPRPAEIVELRGQVAAWPEVLWVGLRPIYRLLNDTSAWVGQSGLDGGQATPLHDRGILGEGQVIGILDTGLDADMCFFRDPVLGLPPVQLGTGAGSPDPQQRKVLVVDFLWSGDDPGNPADWDSQDHGTHVAGSAAGDDFATPGERDTGDGMAPAAKLVIQDGGYAVDDCADLPAIGCPAADLYPFFEQAYLQGARIHSNSYGDRENFTPYDIYSEGSQAADAFMWDHPDFLLLFAAGNNGPGAATVASPATAKNVVAVGATGRGGAAGALASFSSQGPTHDGRIKPDVTAPGSSIVSANNDLDITSANCGTRTSSGTSMACPTVAGLAALVREYYQKGYYPSGTPTPANASTPSSALIKATLIVSARAMEQVGAPPPSDPQGWGRVLLDDALYFPQDVKRSYVADVTPGFSSPSDAVDLHALQVLDSSEPLRVALVWTDYPSSPVALSNLVNDLDLELLSPSGALYLGNVFSGGVSQPGGAPDAVNNVEVLRIDSPEPGSWTVRVRPRAIPQPQQAYALVATGRLPAAGIALDRTSLAIDDTVGGNGDGRLDPGEWVDLPIGLLNSGDTVATGILVEVVSLGPDVLVERAQATLGTLAPGQQAVTPAPTLRVRLLPDLPCNTPAGLRFSYLASGYSRIEDLALPTGSRSTFLVDDLEGPTGWHHVTAESTASAGDWTLGDPDGTAYQPEDDATADPGTICLFTAPNPGGVGADDVDDGVVVARSGSYDLSGHPEARVDISRWFGNRDLGEDPDDYFRLEIRESASTPDLLLEELGSGLQAPTWTRSTFRVADFVPPGPAIELKVSVSDGPGLGLGNIIEGALDEIVFWEPVCTIHDPPPNAVDSLVLARAGDDVILGWTRPAADPLHGETSRYRVYRSESPDAGFVLEAELTDPGPSPSWPDLGAVAGPPLAYYEVIAGNAAGDADLLP